MPRAYAAPMFLGLVGRSPARCFLPMIACLRFYRGSAVDSTPSGRIFFAADESNLSVRICVIRRPASSFQSVPTFAIYSH